MKPKGKFNVTVTLLFLCFHTGLASLAQQANDESGSGVSGSAPGSEGMPDTDAVYQSAVAKSAKNGKTSLAYIGSLVALGMHYNRVNRPVDAARTLRQALQIIDAGALKPAANAFRNPEKIIESRGAHGTVSAMVERTPYPYEETLQELLGQLASAEMSSSQLDLAEQHLSRLIKLKGPNDASDKVSLMSAYSSYAELMRRRHKPKEAAMYQRKADEINASFKPL
ncbi:MAG TPA: hypothetical protein V6C89_17430 [Drouetiella sp.]|jgi:hypothetical protein